MKLIRNSKRFPRLNFCNGKTPLYGRKGATRNNNYRADPKLFQGVVSDRIINFRCHDFQTQLSITWYTKIKYKCNTPRYIRVISCKYYR